MASKKALLGGTQIKVENVSGFDKSRFNAFTAPLGAIVPMAKQLCLPGRINLKVKISAQLPPLASDAFLRSHLKVEAFLVPMRLCYGGFQSFFSGEKICSVSTADPSSALTTAALPFLRIEIPSGASASQSNMERVFGVHSLMDYFGVKWPLTSTGVPDVSKWPQSSGAYVAQDFNIFPFVAYQLCYHHFYRNKLIQRPLFAPPAGDQVSYASQLAYLPFVSLKNRIPFTTQVSSGGTDSSNLLNGSIFDLRQRNYGYDYFTTALPSAQDGSPMSVDTSAGSFTISALRLSNALQSFAEKNQVAGPDFVQVCRARYGKAPSLGVASRPILLGSADFPMYTSGVEQTSGSAQQNTGNPFAGMAARYGRAHAEGSDFVCEADVDEPSYLMVMCSLVPEANYATGIPHDMRIFTESGSIVDLPNSQLELSGMEGIDQEEILWPGLRGAGYKFGYQPRYMWHKAGACNEVHGLFRKGASLEAFIPQRSFGSSITSITIDDSFLRVKTTDLDNITAVSGAISQYGVMIDSSIELYVSEPLNEGELPSLVDPAAEHGHSVYVKRGGISVND